MSRKLNIALCYFERGKKSLLPKVKTKDLFLWSG